MENLCQQITDWLKEMVFSSGGKGAIIGLSGGIDSSVVAGLCRRAFGEECLGLILPCYSSSADREHAEMFAQELALPYKVVNLDTVFDEILFSMEGQKDHVQSGGLAIANIKPRLRMTVLYYFAAKQHYRVIGTGNKSELTIGYFTKYGDSGGDLEPLGELLKEEVRELAKYLHIPREIIEKKPSAGLWEGQSDEGEMGFSYKDLDRYIKGEEVEPSLKAQIEAMQQNSEHKRNMPPVFPKK